ncbi:PAS domain-containing protein [Francisella frigiditurris]|uniref:PAS fold family protein n=1 Tax=Francisella frigiditurris TaxID=1542390 RepID=A0A1J0KU05_9GAMM|nr:PAS domain-containing protein [Francisella frigiditurris]APC97233.1 PAS fold family protein [Francisella frigiditurris]
MQKYLDSPIFNSIRNISSNDVYVFVKDLNSKYIFLSNNLCDLSKLKHNEAVGKKDDEFEWGKAQAEAFKSDDLYVLNTGRSHLSEYLLPFHQLLWIKTEKIPIFDEKNKIIGILGIAQDITYKKVLYGKSQQINLVNHGIQTIMIKILRRFINSFLVNGRNSYFKEYISAVISKNMNFNIPVNLENKLKEDLSTFINNGTLLITSSGITEIYYYNYLVIFLSFAELYQNTTLDEKIFLNIDENIVKLVINRPGKREKIICNEYSDKKLILNTFTKDIMNIFKLNIDIFTVNNLLSTIIIKLEPEGILGCDI